MNDFLIEQADDVLRVTIDHPERGNAMTDDMAAELTRIIEGAAQKASVMVLRGAGDDFCIGRHRGPGGAAPGDALDRRDASDTIFNCYGAFRRAAIPIIGVVQGRALGFGCALASLCDITIAGERAQFQVPEYAHNIMPTMVMSALVDRVGRKALSYLVYSTAVIGAERALSYGIASEVVPHAGAGRDRGQALRHDPQSPALGDRGGEGLSARGARHGDRGRCRLCAQSALDHQFRDRGPKDCSQIERNRPAP